jgi:hypothetical protein
MNFWEMEQKARQAMDPLSPIERELAVYFAEENGRPQPRPLRRRIGAAIVGLGLRLDPDAISVAPRQVAAEAANVRR